MICFNNLEVCREQPGNVLLFQPAPEAPSSRRTLAPSTRSVLADMYPLISAPVLTVPNCPPRTHNIYRLGIKTVASSTYRHRKLSRDRAPWWQRLVMSKERMVVDGISHREALLHAVVAGQSDDSHQPSLRIPRNG